MNKRIKFSIIIAAISIGLVLIGTNVYATTGKTINDSTRIRKKPSTSAEVVETVSKNEDVEIVSEDGEWYKVKYKTSEGTIEGYVRNDLLKVDEDKNTEDVKEDDKESNQEENNQEENNENSIEIKENDVVKLKNDTEIQLLPLIYSCKMGKVSANTEVTVSEMIGIWCHIEADTQDGWVMKSKLEGSETEKEEATDNKEEKEEKEEKTNKTETAGTKLYVKTTTLNLREKAESGSKILTQLDYGDELTVVEVVDSTWTKVKSGSYTGYIATKYASKEKPEDVTSRNAYEPRTSNTEKEKEDTKTTETASTKKTETNKTTTKTETSNKESSKKETTSSSDKKSSSKVTGSDVVEYAKKFLGCKYVYGAAGPNTFDCSGFTSYVYKHFGYSLNRTSSGQRNNGKAVSKKDLQPGDIVCFSGHVGIYVGNNQFIHAPRTGDVVKYTSLSNSYYVKNYITARRIIY